MGSGEPEKVQERLEKKINVILYKLDCLGDEVAACRSHIRLLSLILATLIGIRIYVIISSH